jgi:hypothetical protein
MGTKPNSSKRKADDKTSGPKAQAKKKGPNSILLADLSLWVSTRSRCAPNSFAWPRRAFPEFWLDLLRQAGGYRTAHHGILMFSYESTPLGERRMMCHDGSRTVVTGNKFVEQDRLFACMLRDSIVRRLGTSSVLIVPYSRGLLL